MRTGPRTKPIIERLLARIEIDSDGCWLWQGSTNKGRGQIGSGGQYGRPLGVNVVAWNHYHEPVPAGMKVLQTCGVLTCCNPDHLTLRTQSEVIRSWQVALPPKPKVTRLKVPQVPKARPSAIERVLARIEINEHGCWLWPGSKTDAGYGRVMFNGKAAATHRLMFEFYRGWMPAELDHQCRERSCCNPDHLEPVTHSENVLRGNAATRSLVCRFGHWMLGDNVIVSGRKRGCRTCRRLYHASRRKTAA